ncbi:unnamed protein product [Strongylus vulgaris]|uniref:Uncharacterized protein n=1 Tax=Strongylus vulgaris TaxID=40348 RepID=A0A3P7IAH5_STRVU|nr:unnamed protein product [Strongylus vulgaris]
MCPFPRAHVVTSAMSTRRTEGRDLTTRNTARSVPRCHEYRPAPADDCFNLDVTIRLQNSRMSLSQRPHTAAVCSWNFRVLYCTS